MLKRKRCKTPLVYQSGQAAMELLVSLLVLIPIMFGGVEFARAVSIRQSLSNGVYMATRSISLDPGNIAYATSLVQRSVDADVFGAGNLDPSKTNYGTVIWDDSSCAAAPTLGCTFSYTASLEFSPYIPLFPASTIPISATHFGIVEVLQ